MCAIPALTPAFFQPCFLGWGSNKNTNFYRKPPGEQDHRTLYVSLKHLLTTHYEPDTLPRAVAAAAQRLISKGRRPLIFANTEKELVRIFKHLPCARRWSGQRGSAGEEGGGGSALVVTLHAAAQGLNMQHDADCIICRKQPGDRLEQTKISQWSQKSKKLCSTKLAKIMRQFGFFLQVSCDRGTVTFLFKDPTCARI